eukprot:m.40096 g.40096  ORF g.40096 m.40096 type:complete len:702 (+) comp9626_c0_seq2:297-2402(+)
MFANSATVKMLAPMTGASDVAFRMLCRKYGVAVCFTEMLYAKHFANNEAYRKNLMLTQEDSPVIVQFAAGKASELLQAVEKLPKEHCAGIDINLDWPQQKASSGPYGVFLQNHWDDVIDMVSTVATRTKFAVSCKMRLFPTVAETVERSKQLETAGCAMLTVHGKTGMQVGEGTGVADWDAIKAVKKAVSIPVIANGSIVYFGDVDAVVKHTGCDGVMCGQQLLCNPAFFQEKRPHVCTVASEYLKLCKTYNTSPTVVRDHLANILHRCLLRYPTLRDQLAHAYSLRSFEDSINSLSELLNKEASDADSQRHDIPPHWLCQEQIPFIESRNCKSIRYEGDIDQLTVYQEYWNLRRNKIPEENLELLNKPLLSKSAAKKLAAIRPMLKSKRKRTQEDRAKKPRLEEGDIKEETIVVPRSKAGRILGAGARIVKRLQFLTKTQVKVTDKPIDDSSENQEKLSNVTLKGTQEQIEECKVYINKIMAGNCPTAVLGMRDKKLEKDRLRAAMLPDSNALQIAVDLGMCHEMNRKELHKLSSQIGRIYGKNLISEKPAHLHLTSFQTDSLIHQTLRRQCDGFEQYLLSKTTKRHKEAFPISDIVYLTPDSENPLSSLSSDKVYVMGGLVDENVKSKFTLTNAQNDKITTARLPIPEIASKTEAKTSQVLAINQVFEGLLAVWSGASWEEALVDVVPKRKGFHITPKT